MDHTLHAGCKFNKCAIGHQLGHLALDRISFGQFFHECGTFFPDLFVEQIPAGDNNIPALFLIPGNQKMVGLALIILGGFHIFDINLTHRTKRPFAQDIHGETAFDNAGHPAFNRGMPAIGILNHGSHPGPGNRLGQNHFAFA